MIIFKPADEVRDHVAGRFNHQISDFSHIRAFGWMPGGVEIWLLDSRSEFPRMEGSFQYGRPFMLYATSIVMTTVESRPMFVVSLDGKLSSGTQDVFAREIAMIARELFDRDSGCLVGTETNMLTLVTPDGGAEAVYLIDAETFELTGLPSLPGYRDGDFFTVVATGQNFLLGAFLGGNKIYRLDLRNRRGRLAWLMTAELPRGSVGEIGEPAGDGFSAFRVVTGNSIIPATFSDGCLQMSLDQ